MQGLWNGQMLYDAFHNDDNKQKNIRYLLTMI